MNKPLFVKEFKANYKILLLFMAVLSIYCTMIVAMYDPKLGEMLQEMAESMPEIFAAFGMLHVGTTLMEFLCNYLYGFLLIAFPVVFLIILTNKLMIRYADRGTMAYLFATPHSRFTIVVTQIIFMISSLVILVAYVTILCIVCSEIMFPTELEIGQFVLLNIGLFGALFFLSSVCWLFACLFQDGKRALGFGAGCIIAFILLQMISQVGERASWLKYITPLSLFQPQRMIQQATPSIIALAILFALGMIIYSIAIWVFCKKDLSL